MPRSQRLSRLPSTELAAPLLAWFARARRDLPWREEPRDPYRVWVSEVMLQQTRVEVVVPYFERFTARFPTLRALARAPLDEVLAQWSGLGYYARARNLHRAAQAAGGALPGTAAELAALPGFGPYTSAAVASLAFGEEVPLVDGNVARVLARLLRLPGDPAQARALAWKAAPSLLPRGRAGEFNEALMELGALVCTPRSPKCGDCPIGAQCQAKKHGDPEKFPGPKKKKPRPQLTWAAAAIFRGGAVLLARRGKGELFEGMWDLPSQPVAGVPLSKQRDWGARKDRPRDPHPAALAAAQAAALGCGLRARLEQVGEVNQTLTHRELRVLLFRAKGRGAKPSAAPARAARTPVPAQARTPIARELRWVRAEELAQLGLSSLARKSLRACGVDTWSHGSKVRPSPS